MAYSTTVTGVTGAVLTAAQWNSGVRDNFAALWVFTTAGDLIYATSSTTAARLAFTPYGILTGGATVPAWLAPPATGIGFMYQPAAGVAAYVSAITGYKFPRLNSDCSAAELFKQAETVLAYRSTNLSISASIAETAIAFNADVEDTNWHNTVTNTDRITPVSDGRYICRATIVVSNASGTTIDSMTIKIKTSTGEYLGEATLVNLVNGGTYAFNIQSRKFELTAGQYFICTTERSNDTTTGILVLADVSWLEVERVR